MTVSAQSKNSHDPQPAVLRENRHGWKKILAVVPTIGALMIPGITCPACWPGYAAILSSLGVGFIPSTKYLLPLAAVCLAINLLLLAWDARKQRRLGPLALAFVASLGILYGRFYLEWNALAYGNAVLLVAASVWNAWPAIRARQLRSSTGGTGCPACPTLVQIENTKAQATEA